MSVQQAAAVMTRHLQRMLRGIHVTYFKDLSYIECADLTFIMNEVMFAECEERSLSARGLAKSLGMPHSTLLGRLDLLESRGILQPRAKRLRAESTVIFAPEARARIGEMRKLMIAEGAELSGISV